METNPRMIPQINIGTLGHVDHGKSTLVEAITGKWPAMHSEELKRGITIKLGYADATIYKCTKGGEYTTKDKCLTHACECEPIRTISFVDAPGHETLMATVLAGASLMDAVLLIIAANEKCPQPQTAEHLRVLNIVGMKNIIVVQNKIDLVDQKRAMESYREIRDFVKGTVAGEAPIIPVSAQQKINVDVLIATMEEKFKTPQRDPAKPPKMYVVRSFDINKPGTEIAKLKGGVLGGSLIEGSFRIGEEVEIRPGIQVKGKWITLKSRITGLQKANKNLEEAGPGGLLGMMTGIDPSYSKADSLSGSVAGLPGKMPPVLDKISLEIHTFEKTDIVKTGDILMINVGVGRTIGTVTNLKKGVAEIALKLPIVADKGERAALSKRLGDRWKLFGWGLLK
jgi:translation initiation factor 2 subunit 3